MNRPKSIPLLILTILCLILLNEYANAGWPPRLYRIIDGINYEEYDDGNGGVVRIRKIYYSLGGGFTWSCSTIGCQCSNRPTCNASHEGIYLTPGEGCSYGLCETPPSGSHYVNHCETFMESGSSVLNCSIHTRHCIWEEVGDCMHTPKEPDDWVGYPAGLVSLTLTPCSDNPDTTIIDSLRYKPIYNDVLCYELKATHPMTVEIRLSCSTYEGIAMNALVPDDQSEKKADLILEGAESLVYNYGSAVYTKTVQIDANVIVPVYVKVIDYAAHGRLSAKDIRGFHASGDQDIPKDFEDFFERTDSDSDAYTAWEEYRGFMYDSAETFHHRRLDSAKTEAFICDRDTLIPRKDHFFDTLEVWTKAKLYELGSIGGGLTYPIPWDTLDGFTWYLDYNSRFWYKDHNEPAGEWRTNETLVDPIGLDSLPIASDGSVLTLADQGLIRIVGSDEAAVDSFGTPIYGINIGYKIFEEGEEVCKYRGPAGSGGITIYTGNIDGIIEDWVLYNNLHNVQQAPEVRFILMARTIAHEIGHALGIDEHSGPGGFYECVMKYDDCPEPQDVQTWSNWIARGVGSGYGENTPGGECGYLCNKKRGFRFASRPHFPYIP